MGPRERLRRRATQVCEGLKRMDRYEEKVCSLLLPYLQGRRILSIGCGNGSIESRLAAAVGVPIQGAEVTRYPQPHIATTVYDGGQLPFPRKSFDTTLLVYMLHHTKDPERILADAARVTRGSILILDHTFTNGVSRMLLSAYDGLVNLPYRMPLPFSFKDVPAWMDIFRRQGLRVEHATLPRPLNVFFALRP